MADSVGMADLRAENVSKVVEGFALQSYVLKQLCMIQPSSSWKETFYVETAADLSGGEGSAVKGIPRLAHFPYGEVTWTESAARLIKHGMEGVISWEDATTNAIDVIARSLLRIGRAVAKSVDDEIYDQLTNNITNSVTITAGFEWDAGTIANRDPIQNILDAIKEIQIDNYDVYRNSFLLLSPKDFANLMGNANVRNAGQFWTPDVTKNGKVGRILGLTILVTNSVDADESLVVVGQECITWKTAKALSVETITNPGIDYVIRAWEVGAGMVVNPNAGCKISNTAK